MKAVTSVMLSIGGLVGLGYILRQVLPHSSVVTVDWGLNEYYLPFNILGYWACVAAAVIAGAVQTVRAMLRDAVR